MRRSGLALVLVVMGVPTYSQAYDIDLGPLGHACDTCGGGVVGGLPVIGHAVNEAQAQANGRALAGWIVASRNSASNGAMPIPPDIRRDLTGYASEESMNRARYKIGDAGFANIAHVIEQAGQASAVTLDNIIIFRGPSEAQDRALWAHELTHVDQYREWGIEDFGIRYARDNGSVEGPAYAKQNGYQGWFQARVQNPGIPGLPIMPAGNFPGPQGVGAFCYTPFGRFGPGPIQPFGAPCFITSPQGNVQGQIGP